MIELVEPRMVELDQRKGLDNRDRRSAVVAAQILLVVRGVLLAVVLPRIGLLVAVQHLLGLLVGDRAIDLGLAETGRDVAAVVLFAHWTPSMGIPGRLPRHA